MISICMAYFQRQELLDRTITSIHKSKIKDWELIIVDDASVPPLNCPDAKVIRIEEKDKWYHNPCIPYNMAFKEAKGDVIIIQNPECLHVGDVLKYTLDNIQDGRYISFGCYALNELQTRRLRRGGAIPPTEPKVFGGKVRVSWNGWYNHPVYRPVAYHFCSAITKKDLDVLGGFDERYANGVAFDDDALIRSIRRLGMDVQIPTNPYVIHQYHTHFTYEEPAVWRPLHKINSDLYDRT